MKLSSYFSALCLSILSTVGLHATIGANQQMLLGNPSSATSDPTNQTHYLIQRDQYALDYNNTTREPNWVSWDLTAGDVGGSGRSDFQVDTTLPAGFYQVQTTDYSGSGYDRGHMSPSADRTVTVADNKVVFYMSNMVPQAPDNNQGVWESFEAYCRVQASSGFEVLIISGPSGFAGSTLASGVAIPGYTWKIAVFVPLGAGSAVDRIVAAGAAAIRVVTIKIPNIAGVRNDPWEKYSTTPAQIEADTGYSFFTALPTNIATAFRTKLDGQVATGTPSVTTQPVAQSAPVGGTATFSVTASGDAPLSYQWLKDDNEISGATNSTLNLLNVQTGDAALYDVVVTNNVGSVTSNTAALVISGLPPTITTQPVAKSVAAGTNVVFTVGVGGSPTFSYVWRKGGTALVNGGNVSGATTATLTLSNVQAADIASYDVVVTNSVTSATSNLVGLAVSAAAPTITSQPTAQSVAVGGIATFSIAATGTNPITYQWRKGGAALVNGGTVSGADTAVLKLTGVALADNGTSYDVVVSNGVNPAVTSSAVTLSVGSIGGSVAYTGGSYTEDFNSLASTGTVAFTGLTAPFDLAAAPSSAAGMTGWRLSASTGTPSLVAGTGSGNAGAAYSFGAAGSIDRALGSVASGTVVPVFGVRITNNTSVTITQFTLSYTGEEWRNGGNTATQSLQFAYGVNVADINSTGFVDFSALNFNSPVATATAAALDGNVAANRTAITSTVTGLTWLPGQTIVLRWTDTNDAGNDHGLAIDDLTFTTPVSAAPVTPAILSTTPTNGALAVPGNSPITVTFNQPVTVAGSWFSITSAVTGGVAATVTGGPTTFTFTPPVNFTDNDTITVNIVASQVTEQISNTLHPAANYSFSFNTAAPVAPGIATGPQAQTVLAGGTATFSVVASGTAPFSYQWRKNGTAISGNGTATSSTLTLTNVQSTDVASYDVVISNGVSPAVTSGAVGLTVTPVAPNLVTQPLAQTVAAGGNVTFTVAVTGSTPFAFQWRKGGVALSDGGVFSGVTTATLTLTAVTASEAGSYDVVVTNGVSPFATSNAVTLTVTGGAGSPLNYAGGTYAQNFNTLPAAGTFIFVGTGPFALDAASPNGVGATGLTGWSFSKYAGTGANALFKFDNGSSNAGSAVSYGTASATDRALGSLSSAAAISRFGVALVNTTGQTVTQFVLSYTGEQWRHGGATTANTLTFAYSVGASDINTGTFTPVPALDFSSPIINAITATLDGNAAANRVAVTSTVSGISWAPGQTLILRWTDVDDAGSDDGLAIDDLSFFVPLPPSIITAPAAQSVTTGATATFSVIAGGTAPLSYQWYKDTTMLTNETGSTLTISNAQPANAGNYSVSISNGYGSIQTTPVALSVTQTFAQWAAAAGLPAGQNGFNDDPDNDGIPNGFEYYLGLSPTVANAAGLPTGTIEGGLYVFRFTHSKTAVGITAEVKTTPDFITWSSLVSPLVVESSTSTVETLVAKFPLGQSRFFARLILTTP